MDRAENLVLKDPEPRIHPTAELKACKLGRYSSIGDRVILREVTVGDFSYFERHSEAIYTTIGNDLNAKSPFYPLVQPGQVVASSKNLTHTTFNVVYWIDVTAVGSR